MTALVHQEIERVRNSYKRREETVPAGRYSYFNPGSLFLYQQRERAFLDLLKRENLIDLSGLRILDLGCGHGMWLRELLKYGAQPENLTGTDIIRDRLEVSRKLSPNIAAALADGARLPFARGKFDMVLQSTVLTSILDQGIKKSVANEMVRVLGPKGVIIWYDFRYDNPRNPDVRGIGRKEIQRLFPQCRIRTQKTTLLPPLARGLAGASRSLCEGLSCFPILLTHYLASIRPGEK
ncbi:class I SAM-dependent methyltransferase [candidate division TA06 bacterium]|nr:class I SAM-dependent methyltransferase [candidate division TA06 bacterium]